MVLQPDMSELSHGPTAQALDGPFPLTRGQQSTRIRQMQGNLGVGMVNEWVGPATYDSQTSRSWLAPHKPSLWIGAPQLQGCLLPRGPPSTLTPASPSPVLMSDPALVLHAGKYTLPRASSPKVTCASLSRALMRATVPEASERLSSACGGSSAPRSPLLLDMWGNVRWARSLPKLQEGYGQNLPQRSYLGAPTLLLNMWGNAELSEVQSAHGCNTAASRGCDAAVQLHPLSRRTCGAMPG